jgi:hypothetical protein
MDIHADLDQRAVLDTTALPAPPRSCGTPRGVALTVTVMAAARKSWCWRAAQSTRQRAPALE